MFFGFIFFFFPNSLIRNSYATPTSVYLFLLRLLSSERMLFFHFFFQSDRRRRRRWCCLCCLRLLLLLIAVFEGLTGTYQNHIKSLHAWLSVTVLAFGVAIFGEENAESFLIACWKVDTTSGFTRFLLFCRSSMFGSKPVFALSLTLLF